MDTCNINNIPTTCIIPTEYEVDELDLSTSFFCAESEGEQLIEDSPPPPSQFSRPLYEGAPADLTEYNFCFQAQPYSESFWRAAQLDVSVFTSWCKGAQDCAPTEEVLCCNASQSAANSSRVL